MTQSELPLAAPAVPPSTCTLYHGDCLDVMPKLEAGSVQMVFADLPYGITHKHWDMCIELNSIWPWLFRASTQNAAYIFSATGAFAADIINSKKSIYRYDLIWHKKRITGFLNANRMPLRSHEQLLVFYQKLPTYHPQKTQGVPWSKRIARNANHRYGGQVIDNSPQISNGDRHPTSVISINSSNKKSSHPTQKPVALLEWLIATYTNPGDTVLDPVFGSNTTAVACARLGRNYIGIEKDSEYFRIGRERIDAERARLGLTPSEVR